VILLSSIKMVFEKRDVVSRPASPRVSEVAIMRKTEHVSGISASRTQNPALWGRVLANCAIEAIFAGVSGFARVATQKTRRYA